MTEEQDVHERFRDWAVARGVEIHSDIAAKELPGKGIGIVATKKIDVQDLPLSFPFCSLAEHR
jgi:hypothetical protein